jgi:hypothetical protein
MPSATLAPTPSAPSHDTTPAAPPPRATDDEILGITSPRKNSPRDTQQLEFDFDADVPTPTTTLSSRARAGVWPDEGLAVPSANENQLQIPRSARNDNPQKIVDTRTANAPDASVNAANAHATTPEPALLRATFDANPELRAARRDATAYRESFDTPDAAREATALLADVNHMDALFFSRRPEDHASLARAIANLDPTAFTSLAQAMQSIAANADGPRTAGLRPAPLTSPPVEARHAVPARDAWQPSASTTAVPSADENQLQIPRSARNDNTLPDANANTDAPGATSANADGLRTAGVSPAPLTPSPHAQLATNSATANEPQLAFLHAANAAAVEGVVAAIEAQVERLLPEGVAKNARTRVVGEIYRELDSSLRSNPQFAAQLRDAFRSGSFDDGHQRAIVSLLTGRARQALPGVAKRVLSEWTSTIVSAANERRTRQRTAERRIDIAGSSGAGNDGRRSMSPRDLDYARLTDADILNL